MAIVILVVLSHSVSGFEPGVGASFLARGRPCIAARPMRSVSAALRASADTGAGESIVQRVNGELKAAMRAKDTAVLTALRNMKAALLLAMKEEGTDDLPDAKAIAIMRKLAKMRQESIDMFAKAAGGEERVAEEAAELRLIERFLPRLADEAQTRSWIEEAIANNPAADVGRVMGALMKAHRDDLDGKLAQRLVKEMLG
ncbi:hypothetical protein KFE25_010997 [Diacronema lutheri]|uniref:GatB/YqeY domain-containing protein n=2 Tax=Diacronema lutheri TaxID=2081491 RepID=A0A8J5X5M0_DIALT|nr:hypothetical protein KFE25_010997 [Diacronema lutheri]